MNTTSSPRYAAPLAITRPRGARLIEAFSPKLARRVRLFDHACFRQWLRLEVDPKVRQFCEYPARLGVEPASRLIDFWVLRDDGERFLVIDDAELEPQAVDGIPVQQVTSAELAAAATWVMAN